MRVVIELSDPWEMGEQLGWPAIPATVVTSDGDDWLLEVEQPFEFQEATYQFLVASARHKGAPLYQCATTPVSASFIRTTVQRARSAAPCDVSWWRGGHAMEGTLRAPGPPIQRTLG